MHSLIRMLDFESRSREKPSFRINERSFFFFSVILKYMPAWLALSYPRSTAVQKVAGSILRSGISFSGNISSYL